MQVLLVMVLTCHQQLSQHHRLGKVFLSLIFLWLARYLNDDMTCIPAVHYYMVLSHFQLVSVNTFRNPFLIFNLDKQHLFWLDKLPIALSVELGISSSLFLKFSLPSCTPLVCGFILYSRGRGMSFFPSRLVDSTFLRMELLLMPSRISQA